MEAVDAPFAVGVGQARPIASHALHIWVSDLDVSPEAMVLLETALSPDERERAQRFRYKSDSCRFIATRGMLRRILAAYLGADAAELEFHRNAQGKPAVAGCSLQFNMAQSSCVAIYGISRNRAVGVDLEQIRPHVFAKSVVDLYFSHRERAALERLPAGDEYDAAFLEAWTRKEAYLKGVGLGIAKTDLKLVDLAPSDEGVATVNGWNVKMLRPRFDYVAAVAAPGSDWELLLVSPSE